MNTQNTNSVFVFDMDNTLIETDKANNLAYSEAISLVLGSKYDIDHGERITRGKLRAAFPDLTRAQLTEIIARKEQCFESYFKDTKLNQNLFMLLKDLHSAECHTILLTNSHSERAVSLCDYYNLTKYFDRCFFHEDSLGNKYTFLQSIGYDLQNVILYENEEGPASEANANGINTEKIIKVEF